MKRLKQHKLVVKFTAHYTHTGRVLNLTRTFIRRTRKQCNIISAEYLAELGRYGFVIYDITREDSEI